MTKRFYGTKCLTAIPMTRHTYNQYRGWELPANEDGRDAGYLVEYQDGGASNHPDHLGCISWSPQAQFDAAYQSIDAMSFGHAIAALKAGERVCRAGWNGRNMFLVLVPGSTGLTVDEGRPLAKAGLEVGTSFNYLPHIDMWTAQGDLVPWLASQSDMLAEDWMIVSSKNEEQIAA